MKGSDTAKHFKVPKREALYILIDSAAVGCHVASVFSSVAEF